MALTFTKLIAPFPGMGKSGMKTALVSITADASYANGTGYAIVPADFAAILDINTIKDIIPFPAAGYVADYTASTGYLKCYRDAGAASAMAEAATNEASLSGVVFKALVIGY